MDSINIKNQKKIQLFTGNDKQTIEIGETAIKAGFLKQLPGSTLAIFLYLISQLNDKNYVLTNSTIISNYTSYNVNEIKEGLNYLNKHDIIKIKDEREGNYSYRIYIYLDELSLNKENSNHKAVNNKQEFKNNRQLRKNTIEKQSVSNSELKKALSSFMQEGEKTVLIRNGIDQWLKDFEQHQIKELIRRVDKWLDRHKGEKEKAFYYLQGIIDDWYEKEIFTYKRLQHFDKLYRETRELATSYGLKWQNINSSQMEILKNWLVGDQALSVSVAKFAIKEAIKRKSDGQPSLKYIEDNFIKPWQKAGIKNINEAKNHLSQTGKKNTKTHKTSTNKPKNKWEDFSWDFNFKDS